MYRIDELLKQDRKLFHTRDLALLWGIRNDNSLYTIIKRYVKKGILIKIHKGFYATISLGKLDPLDLAFSSVHRYAYLSTESVLTSEGIIFQQSSQITLVSSFSKRFRIKEIEISVRQLRDDFLFNDTGIREEDGIKKATKERAVADLLYFNPRHFFDTQNIDWKKVKSIQRKVGYI